MIENLSPEYMHLNFSPHPQSFPLLPCDRKRPPHTVENDQQLISDESKPHQQYFMKIFRKILIFGLECQIIMDVH